MFIGIREELNGEPVLVSEKQNIMMNLKQWEIVPVVVR
jgi:hypothetical protein